MFGPSSLQQSMRQLGNAETEEEFERAVSSLRSYLKSIDINSECLMEIEKRAYYLPNSYSEKDTKEKIEQAKKRVQNYINEMMSESGNDKRLLVILENFYLFLEGLLEREPHKRAGIQKEQLEILKVKNPTASYGASKLNAASCGVFDPRGSRQMSASSHLARCSRE